MDDSSRSDAAQHHFFLAPGHDHAERRTWALIWLCGATMVVEIGGGALFGSIALVADGLHMTTHAGTFLLAALAYRFARRHAADPRFSFGTGKVGDLAGFTSAVVLAMIALLIAVGSVQRLVTPEPVRFAEALPIACLGLAVNLASAWLLSGGHDHGRDHGRDHGHTHALHGDNNMRAAVIHVAADAAVSVLVILALLLGHAFGWSWTDPLAGLIGAAVIANWAWTLVRDTGAILLDMTPDHALADAMRAALETEGDRLTDLHVWRLGPGHLGAILCVASAEIREADFYRAKLARFHALSHVTIETRQFPRDGTSAIDQPS